VHFDCNFNQNSFEIDPSWLEAAQALLVSMPVCLLMYTPVITADVSISSTATTSFNGRKWPSRLVQEL
jgi:hypothetical protein